MKHSSGALIAYGAAFALFSGCAGTAPGTQDGSVLPEIDIVQVKENSEEALKAAREARAAIDAVDARLAEIDKRPAVVSADGANNSSAKIEELETRLAFLAEAVKDLQAKVAALQDASASRLPAKTATVAPVPSPAPAVPAAGSENDAYQAALRAFNSRNYEQAQKMFSDIIRQYPAGAFTANCWYWSGECSYALLDWTKAVLQFQKVLTFANSAKADAAQLKLGMCYMKMGQNELAKTELKKLIEQYPGSEYVPRAQKYLSDMK
ncbi:MAG TPA: tetratricopeptide repeat protein [Chitinivibrionales bacterium]|nr:tetratricopeptide repeat protein [Chitinivibrionales bacterium]